MNRQTMLRAVPVALCFAALVAVVSGCYTFARVPASYIANQHPAELYVRDAEGAVFSLSNPSIVKDSLLGTDETGQVSLNLREVDAMAVRTISKPKTAGAIGGAVAVLGLVAFGGVKATQGRDCQRIPNRNNMCIEHVAECKYSACVPDSM
jgi:hypothetical protein